MRGSGLTTIQREWLDGIVWKHVDALTAAGWLPSARKPVVYSAAHPIIESIRAVGMSPPGASGYQTRFCRSAALLACRWCGAEFPILAQDIRKAILRDQSLYCSNTCASSGSGARQSGPTRERFVECLVCHLGFKPRNAGQRYCTRKCGFEARKGRTAKRMLTFIQVCPICDSEFRPKSSRTIFCSRECAGVSHSRHMIGSGNSRFKTGTSYANWFRLMRPLILERDGGMCAGCGASPPPLQFERKGVPTERSQLVIHHINEKPQDNVPENLITLCTTCHIVHHKSATTPFPRLFEMAAERSRSMTSKWQAHVTSLQEAYSSTTA